MRSDQLRAQLAHFTGSETFTHHTLIRTVLMTEGVSYLADAAGAHWLTDAIASYVLDQRAQQETFQAWHLAVDPTTRKAILTMADGNSSKPIINQEFDYTDFPLDKFDLWLVASGSTWVMMLPSEY
jgi:hypothetical protein